MDVKVAKKQLFAIVILCYTQNGTCIQPQLAIYIKTNHIKYGELVTSVT